jgi:ribosomal protein S14
MNIKSLIKILENGHHYKTLKLLQRIKNLLNRGGVLLKSPKITKCGSLYYRCNICGRNCLSKVVELSREQTSCHHCGATVRRRAIIYVLSVELFGESLAIPNFPKRSDIKGIGMSDWAGYAVPLAKKTWI